MPVAAAPLRRLGERDHARPAPNGRGARIERPDGPSMARMPLPLAPVAPAGAPVQRTEAPPAAGTAPAPVYREWSLDRAGTTAETAAAPAGTAPEAGEGERIDLDALEERLMVRIRNQLRIERERTTGWI